MRSNHLVVAVVLAAVACSGGTPTNVISPGNCVMKYKGDITGETACELQVDEMSRTIMLLKKDEDEQQDFNRPTVQTIAQFQFDPFPPADGIYDYSNALMLVGAVDDNPDDDFSYLALGGTWVPIKIGNIQVTVTSQGATTPHGTFTAILYWTTSSDPLNAADNTSGLKVDEDKWVQLDGSF